MSDETNLAGSGSHRVCPFFSHCSILYWCVSTVKSLLERAKVGPGSAHQLHEKDIHLDRSFLLSSRQ